MNVSIQITIIRDLSIICVLFLLFSVSPSWKSCRKENAIYDVLLWLDCLKVFFLCFSEVARPTTCACVLGLLVFFCIRNAAAIKRWTKIETVQLVLSIFSIHSDCIMPVRAKDDSLFYWPIVCTWAHTHTRVFNARYCIRKLFHFFAQ